MTVMQGKVQAVEAIAGTGSGGGERSSDDDGMQAAHAGAEAILNCAREETGADYQGAGTQTRPLRKRSKQLEKSQNLGGAAQWGRDVCPGAPQVKGAR